MTLFADERQDMGSQKIRMENKKLAKEERLCTVKLLKNLVVVDRNKLYCDYGYPSLHKYIVGDLGYSDSEAYIRVGTVRFMQRSKKITQKVIEGRICMTNAAAAENALSSREKKEASLLNDPVESASLNGSVESASLNEPIESASLNEPVDSASLSDPVGPADKNPKMRLAKKNDEAVLDRITEASDGASIRGFKGFLDAEFKRERTETTRWKAYELDLFDRVRKKFGDENLSIRDLVRTMIERELKAPAPARKTKDRPKKPIAQKSPVGSKESIAQEGPVGSKESIAQKSPVGSKESIAQEGPVGSKESIAQKGPVGSKESIAQKSPVGSKESIAQEGPVGSKESIAQTEEPGRLRATRARGALPEQDAEARKSAGSKESIAQTEESRYITAAERREAYTGECGNCGIGYNLEYDHIVKFSHGGANTASNLQMLCRACNGRKEIRARASGFFG